MKRRWLVMWVGLALLGMVACTDNEPLGESDGGGAADATSDVGGDSSVGEDGGGDGGPTDGGSADGGDGERDDAGDASGVMGDERFAGELRRPVEVIEDDYGMKHITAESLEDLFFMNGFVYATDRFGQMEFYRRIATGTLSESLGALDDQPIQTDVLLRTLGLKRKAEKYWEENYDPDDEAFIVVEAFCRGVNRYLEARRTGKVDEPAAVHQLFPPDRTRDWEPSDVLATGKLLALQLTYIADVEIEITQVRDQILSTYTKDASEPGLAARVGLLHDVLRFAPSKAATHLDGFPESGEALSVDPPRLPISDETFADAQSLHEALSSWGIGADSRFGTGSNNWTLAGKRTASGHPNVANDPHLGLQMPTIFYPIHLKLENDVDGREPMEIVGASILGIPGIVIGRNNAVAWGTTVGFYDYVDVYRESLSGPQSEDSPAKVDFEGKKVEVEQVTERIKVGAFGNIDEEQSFDLNLEIVPHHGPILPAMEQGRPTGRTETEALSVKWVGLQPNNDMAFLTDLWRAETPSDVEKALDYYTVGSSNFVFGFTSGDIFYSGQSNIPIREAGAQTFDPRPASEGGNPTGNAPIFVLPGQGGAEWDGFVPEENIPHAKNPEKGYIITANNDQVGTTLDNNPLDDSYYLGGMYASGYRGARIEELIAGGEGGGAAGEGDSDGDGKLSLTEQTAIQNDNKDLVAQTVVPHMVKALEEVLDDQVDASERPELKRARMRVKKRFGGEAELKAIKKLLEEWDYVTPGTRNPTGEDADRSAAALLFNVAMVNLIARTLGDEFAAIGRYKNGRFDLPYSSVLLPRVMVWALEHPEEAQTYDSDLGDTLLFDDMGTTDRTETRLTVLFEAVAEARAVLGSNQVLDRELDRKIRAPDSTDPADWIWGNHHGLTLGSLLPIGDFARPETGLPFFPRGGGEFAVSPCNHGNNDYDFTCGSGSSLRMVHDMNPEGPVTYNAVPGGYSMNPQHDDYFSEFDLWQKAQPRKLETDFSVLRQSGEGTRYVP